MEADKNQLISKKNTVVVKRKELWRKIVAFQHVGPSNQGIEPFNPRTREIAFISEQGKLKAYILDAFDSIKL